MKYAPPDPLHRSRPLPWLMAALLLAGCGGGSGTPTAYDTAAGANTGLLTPLFPTPSGSAGTADPSAVSLKACMMEARQVGTAGQAGYEFLDSLVVEVLPAATAPLYDAQTGKAVGYTNRAYKGSNGAAGAPPLLWGGVAGQSASGYVGFGAPCTPTSMTTPAPVGCYWLTDTLNGAQHVAVNVILIGDTRPETSTGGAPLSNPGWGTMPAFQFWYEASPGAVCSAPGSKAIWHN